MFHFLSAAPENGHIPAFTLTACEGQPEGPSGCIPFTITGQVIYTGYVPQRLPPVRDPANPTVCVAQLRIAAAPAAADCSAGILPDCVLSMHVNCATFEMCVRSHAQMELFVGEDNHQCVDGSNSIYLSTAVEEHQIGFITPAGAWLALRFRWMPSWLARREMLQNSQKWHAMVPHAGHAIYNQDTLFRYAEDMTAGEGGFSRVKKAMHVETGAIVAVKQTTSCLASFTGPAVLREAFILSQLNHPSIIEFIRADISHPHEGLDLVLAYKPLDLASALHTQSIHINAKTHITRFVHQMLEALQYLEARGIVHGDIKPANILCAPVCAPFPQFEQTWDFWLTDFNIAMPTGTHISYRGTAGFAPPEMYNPLLQRSHGNWLTLQPSMDIYSLFVTLTVMVTNIAGRQANNPRLLFWGNQVETPTHKFIEASGELDHVLHTLQPMGSKYADERPAATALLKEHFPCCDGSCFATRGAKTERIQDFQPLEIPAKFLEWSYGNQWCAECNGGVDSRQNMEAVELLRGILLERSQSMIQRA